jgi:hypothetical protein
VARGGRGAKDVHRLDDRAGKTLVAVDSAGATQLLHQHCDAVAFELDAGADGKRMVSTRPAGSDRHRLVRLIPADDSALRPEKSRDLLGDRREDLVRGRLASDQRRDAP